MTPILKTSRGASYCAEALDALRCLRDDGQRFAMAWVDGPYFMGKGEWDPTLSLDAAVAWYAPYLEALTAVCAPSASVYLWGTDELEAELRRPMRALGWTFRGRVTWNKGVAAMAGKVDTGSLRCWYDVTEVCGFYQREEWSLSGGAASTIAHAANADERNPCTAFFVAEREAAGMTRRDLAAHFPSRTGGLTGCVSNWEGGQNFPTWEVWARCAAAMAECGPKRDRPYLVLPEVWGQSGDPLRASYDHLRAEYEASRPAFNCPIGVSNVWTSPSVGGAERLRTPDGETHPCQKPLAFAERAVLASTRPGEVVLDLFAGTHRIAVAVERTKEARSWVAVEQDPRWAAIVRPHLQWDAAALAVGAQPSLFGGARG